MTAEQRTRLDSLLFTANRICDEDLKVSDIYLYIMELRYAVERMEEVLD